MIRSIILILITNLLLLSCGNNSHTQKQIKHINKKTLKGVNRILTQKDEDEMRGFARRRKWNVKLDSTGYFYEIYQHGNGTKVSDKSFVTLKYKVFLLDGTVCYNSDSTGLLRFRVGQTDIESGLDNGVRKLREGDKARFIFPPFLAHGLLGDEKKIPPRSIIIYDVELIEVSDY